MKQRSEQWFKAKEGRFSASKISLLLGKDTLQKTKNAIDNYAFEMAVESVYGGEPEEDRFVSFDLQRGIDLEPLAFRAFKQLKDCDFLDVTETGFYKYGKHAGASPDGGVSDNSGLEIKCPRRKKFFKIVANGESEIDSSYIAQMQMQMLCTNTKQVYFFNYLIEKGLEYWHEIIVQRDEDMIDLIKERINDAVAIKLSYIDKLNDNRQF